MYSGCRFLLVRELSPPSVAEHVRFRNISRSASVFIHWKFELQQIITNRIFLAHVVMVTREPWRARAKRIARTGEREQSLYKVIRQVKCDRFLEKSKTNCKPRFGIWVFTLNPPNEQSGLHNMATLLVLSIPHQFTCFFRISSLIHFSLNWY